MRVNSEYASEILENIAKLKDESEKVTLIAGQDQQRVRVHRILLAASSNFFATIYGGKIGDCKNDLTLDGVDGKLLKEIISYLYTGHLELSNANARVYMVFALKYDFKLLQKKCAEFRSGQISIGNCIDWLIFADKYYMEKLRGNALRMVCKEFGKIAPQRLCKLDFESFEEVIKNDTNTAREELIFDRMVQWIQFDEIDRSKYASDLLKCIRFKHIPTKALIEKVDAFCTKFRLDDLIKREIHERLLSSRPFYDHRIGYNNGVFELYRTDTGHLHIRHYKDDEDCWETVVTIFVESRMKYCGIVFCDKNFFIIGGSSGEGPLSKDIHMFDLETKTRKKFPNMHFARDDFQPIVIDHFIYVMGGYNGVTGIPDCERFDTKLKKWTILKPMLHARYGYTAAVMNGCIYVTGGFKSKGTGKPNLVQRYDPTKNEWTKVASVMDPRFQGVLVEWKGLLYAIGVNKAIERYDRTRNEWDQPDVSDSGDAILLVFPKLQLKRDEGYRQQIEIRKCEYFDRFCIADSQNLFLADFTENQIL